MKTLVAIIFCLCAMVKVQAQISPSTGVQMGTIMPGPSSVYGIVFTNDDMNSINLYSASIKQYDVYKDEKGTGNFKKILSLTFPTSFADFRSRVGEEVAQQVKNNFNTNADEEAYKMLVAGDPNKMGFLVFSKIFLKLSKQLVLERTKTDHPFAYHFVAFQRRGEHQGGRNMQAAWRGSRTFS